MATTTTTGLRIPGINKNLTGGWWVAIGCLGAVILSSTPIAPIVLGIMSIALIFQIENLLKGT